MNRISRAFEKVFVDAALAEGSDFPLVGGKISGVMSAMDCAFMEVAFAEAGVTSEAICAYNQQDDSQGQACHWPAKKGALCHGNGC